jgi:hypothetical protein
MTAMSTASMLYADPADLDEVRFVIDQPVTVPSRIISVISELST